MLKHLTSDQARFIALLAGTARTERDKRLGNVPEADLGGTEPGRGEHNPTADLGLDPVPPEADSLKLLQAAMTGLARSARVELYALMRMGQDDLAAPDWQRGVLEAGLLGDQTITAALMEDADLHEHLAKALFEAKAG